jgi:hypothetical protein
MEIGIGLPNPVPNTSGITKVDWARRAEGPGFPLWRPSTESCSPVTTS